METRYVIPQELMGDGMSEDNIKRRLLELNAEFEFDLGGRHNLWHPDIESCQGVFYRNRHVCTMDRGTCPEFSCWTFTEEFVPILQSAIRHREFIFVETDGTVMAKRAVKDKCIQVGWRYTLRAIAKLDIPGCGKQEIEEKFGVTLDGHDLEDIEVLCIESAVPKVTDKAIAV